MAEFPHFQNVLNKYKNQEFVVIGVNAVPRLDELAAPFFRNKNYGFLSLKVPDAEWPKATYGMTAYPVNFLLDGDGRVLFKPHTETSAEERVLDSQVELLLSHAKAGSHQ